MTLPIQFKFSERSEQRSWKELLIYSEFEDGTWKPEIPIFEAGDITVQNKLITDLVNLLRDRMLEKSTITVDDELTQIIRKTISVSIGWDSRLPGGIDPRNLIKKSSLIKPNFASEAAGTVERIDYLPENLEDIGVPEVKKFQESMEITRKGRENFPITIIIHFPISPIEAVEAYCYQNESRKFIPTLQRRMPSKMVKLFITKLKQYLHDHALSPFAQTDEVFANWYTKLKLIAKKIAKCIQDTADKYSFHVSDGKLDLTFLSPLQETARTSVRAQKKKKKKSKKSKKKLKKSKKKEPKKTKKKIKK